ncbi:MAG: Tad domain-containing protein [Acidimicrobiia bacterium]|nr:Tad domain-containing protein [Acidimicrobiia bacterium]
MSVLRRIAGDEDQRRFTLVFVALSVVMLFTFVAIVVDLGNVRQVANNEQNSSDSGVLAAAQDLGSCDGTSGACTATSTAITHAANYAASTLNSSLPQSYTTGCPAGSSCYTAGTASNAPTIVVTSPYAGSNQKIHAQVCQRVVYFFAEVIGQRSSTPCKSATAGANATAGRCGICVLGTAGTTLIDTAGGNLLVKHGDVVVNSTGNPSSNKTGGGTFTAANGTIGGPGVFSGPYSPTPINEAAIPDPLAGLPACIGIAPCPTATGPGDSVNLDNQTPAADFSGGLLKPGVYNNISVSNTGGLNPGIYVITGDFHASNSHALTMNGVMLYFACTGYPTPCTVGSAGGNYQWTGGGATSLSAQTSGPYAGVSIFFDRNNTEAVGVNQLTAGGTSSITGTIYMKDAGVTVTAGGATIGSSLVLGALTYTGGGNVTIDPGAGVNASSNSVSLLQ